MTVQSVTCQPYSPSRRTARMCQSWSRRTRSCSRTGTAARSAGRPRRTPRPRIRRRPAPPATRSWRRRGCLGVQELAAVPTSGRPLDVDGRRPAEVDVQAVVARPGSPGSPPSGPRRTARRRSPAASSSCRTSISGSCSASWASAVAAPLGRRSGAMRRRSPASAARSDAPPAVGGTPSGSPIRTSASPQSLPISPGRTSAAGPQRPAVEDADRGHLAVPVRWPTSTPVAGRSVPGEHPRRRRPSRRPDRARP